MTLLATSPIFTFIAPSVPSAQAVTINYSTGAAAQIANLINTISTNGGWLSSIQTCYDGIGLGQTNVTQLQTLVDSLGNNATSNWQQIFYWYYVMEKFHVSVNPLVIKAALDAAPMMQNGLPITDNSQGYPAFSLYDRYIVHVYKLSETLNYETSKWNLTAAYNGYKNAIDTLGQPALWVSEVGNTSGIDYGPRYYDEGGQTAEMFLEFYKAGITDGIVQAEKWWDWTNKNLWNTFSSQNGMYYQYAVSRKDFECEAGGLNSIVWQMYHYNHDTANTNNLIIDMQTRWLSSQWSSPQWANYVTVHSGLGVNSQTRMQNTIMSWAAMLGVYPFMTSAMKSTVQDMLLGSTSAAAPAWSLLEQSDLYHSGVFSSESNVAPSVEATANAACLMTYLATVPTTGSVAVPLSEIRYEDINNLIDGEISNIKISSNQLTVSVLNPGDFVFTLGVTPVTYNIPSAGTWVLTFSSDWNTVTNAVLTSPLSASRIYYSSDVVEKKTYTIKASSDSNCKINPSGSVSVKEGDSQTFILTPNQDYWISQVLVNGNLTQATPGPDSSLYTFSNVKADQTITVHATISPLISKTPPSNTPTSIQPSTLTGTPSEEPWTPTLDTNLVVIAVSIVTVAVVAILLVYFVNRKKAS
jgi:hypothetical protein